MSTTKIKKKANWLSGKCIGKKCLWAQCCFKNNAFMCSLEPTITFEALKRAVTHPPILVLPDFSHIFLIEYNSFIRGIGVILMQGGRRISYCSHILKDRFLLLSTYEEKFLAFVSIVRRWRHQLLSHSFKIKTNHQSNVPFATKDWDSYIAKVGLKTFRL